MIEEPRKTGPRLLEVTAVRDIHPWLRRITLGGAAIDGLQTWPAAHIKLFFPRPGQDQPQLPSLDGQGHPVWPPPAERPYTRSFSVRRHVPERRELEVDFVLHAPQGPASAWAAGARPGMRLGLAGPDGPNPMLPPADWYLLAGDLSAIGALAALLENLSREARGMAFIQVPSAFAIQAFHAPPDMQVTWLVEAGEPAQRDLVHSACNAIWLPGRPFAWIAGEGGQVVAIRDHMRRERGLRPSEMYAIPYWKRKLTEEDYHAERHRVMDELTEAAQ